MTAQMTEFDIKKGWYSKIEGEKLEQIMKDEFGAVAKEEDLLITSFGAMKRIEVRVISKTSLGVATINVDDFKQVKDEDILASKRKLNEFLLQATGFTPKDRLKRAKDKAKAGKL